MKEFLQMVFGTGNAAQIAATLLYAYVGAFVSLLYQSTKRDPLSKFSPVHFSLSFLWCDNSKRILRSIILIFICVRFAKEIFGIDITLYFSFIIGFSLDKLSQIIKQKAGGWVDKNTGGDDAGKTNSCQDNILNNTK